MDFLRHVRVILMNTNDWTTATAVQKVLLDKIETSDDLPVARMGVKLVPFRSGQPNKPT